MSCGIYCIENLINGHKYIGQSMAIEARWAAHKRNAFNPNFKEYNKILYQAFRKYGIENFSFTILEEIDSSFLNEREIYWIAFYNTFYGEGYNATPGGEASHYSIHVQDIYDKWDNGYTVKEIISEIGCAPMTVRKYLSSYQNYSEEEARKRAGIKMIEKQREEGIISNVGRSILQYTLTGEFVKKWRSTKEIERELHIDDQNITRIIKGTSHKISHGYIWTYEGEKLPDIDKIKKEQHIQKCEQNGMAKLNWQSVHEIQDLLRNTKLSQRAIGEKYGVSTNTVSNINTGYSWKEDNREYPIRKRK